VRKREREEIHLAKLDLLTLTCLQIKVACEALGLCTTRRRRLKGRRGGRGGEGRGMKESKSPKKGKPLLYISFILLLLQSS
jgi:hypothetical protein